MIIVVKETNAHTHTHINVYELDNNVFTNFSSQNLYSSLFALNNIN